MRKKSNRKRINCFQLYKHYKKDIQLETICTTQTSTGGPPSKAAFINSTNFKGQIIVFTGLFRDKDLEKFVLENSGTVETGNVTKKTTLVVYKSAEQSKVKLSKAIENNIKTIQLEELRNICT
jgi:NAD-dependent DNA ligase